MSIQMGLCMLLLVCKYNIIKVFTGLQLYMNIFFCIHISVITQYYNAMSPFIVLLHCSLPCCIMRLPHYNLCPVLGYLDLLVLLCMHISVTNFVSVNEIQSVKKNVLTLRLLFINQLIHFLYMEMLKLSFMFMAIDLWYFLL